MSLVAGSQIRAARALLGLDQTQLAEAAGVALNTVSRIEGYLDRVPARHDTVRRLQRALEEQGIEFLDDGGPGVRLRAPSAA
jgi:transcriptional regulator with XRE-family HTH domain